MDYRELASELLNNLHALHKVRPQRNTSEVLRGEEFVLNYLSRCDDVLPGEIGDEMNVSSARIAQTLNSLEKKGFITRRIDVNDRRKILVSITPAGKELAVKSQAAMIESIAETLEMLGETDAKEYVRIMNKLATQTQAKNQRKDSQ